MLGTRVNRHTLLKTNDVFPKKWMVGVNDSIPVIIKWSFFRGHSFIFGVCVSIFVPKTLGFWYLFSYEFKGSPNGTPFPPENRAL